MKRNVRKNALKTFVTRHVLAHSKAPKFIHVLTLELCQPQRKWTPSEGRVRLWWWLLSGWFCDTQDSALSPCLARTHGSDHPEVLWSPQVQVTPGLGYLRLSEPECLSRAWWAWQYLANYMTQNSDPVHQTFVFTWSWFMNKSLKFIHNLYKPVSY